MADGVSSSPASADGSSPEVVYLGDVGGPTYVDYNEGTDEDAQRGEAEEPSSEDVVTEINNAADDAIERSDSLQGIVPVLADDAGPTYIDDNEEDDDGVSDENGKTC